MVNPPATVVAYSKSQNAQESPDDGANRGISHLPRIAAPLSRWLVDTTVLAWYNAVNAYPFDGDTGSPIVGALNYHYEPIRFRV
jgi:hypothetical protein